MADKPTVLLEGWQVLMLHGRPHQLLGFSSNHPRLPGFRRWIQTSRVLHLDPAKHEAETVNTHYRLQRSVTDMAFEGAYPVRIVLEDLAAHCDRPGGTWSICRHEGGLADGIPDHRAAILAMLAILDRRQDLTGSYLAG